MPLLTNIFAAIASGMEDTTTYDVEVLFKLLEKTILYSESPNKVNLYDHTTVPTGIQIDVRENGIGRPSVGEKKPSAAQQTNPYIRQAYEIKGMLTQHAPYMLDEDKVDDPDSLGFLLHLLPGIPAGVVLLHQKGFDRVVRDNTIQGGIHYHKFTILDTRSNEFKEKSFTIWKVYDNRGQGDQQEIDYFVIPEIPSNKDDEIRYDSNDPRIYNGILKPMRLPPDRYRRSGVIPEKGEVFGHLPHIS